MRWILTLFWGISCVAFSVDKAFLLSFHKSLVDSLPSSFEAELQGVGIEKKLASIPKDMIQSGRKLAVKISYKKDKGVKLEITGLTAEGRELYGDIFQPYVRMFTLGPLLLNPPTEKTWENYTLTTIAGNEKSVVISLSPKNTANEYILFIDRTTLRLLRLDFKGSGFLNSTILKFTQKENYWIPEVFLNKTIMDDGTDTLPDRYQLVNIKVGK